MLLVHRFGRWNHDRAGTAVGLAFFDAYIDDSDILANRRVSLIPGSSLTIAAFGPAQTTLKITTATGAISAVSR